MKETRRPNGRVGQIVFDRKTRNQSFERHPHVVEIGVLNFRRRRRRMFSVALMPVLAAVRLLSLRRKNFRNAESERYRLRNAVARRPPVKV